MSGTLSKQYEIIILLIIVKDTARSVKYSANRGNKSIKTCSKWRK